MRSLVILKGLVREHKERWVREEALENFFVSIDPLRKLYYRPELGGHGADFLSRSFEDVVYRRFIEIVCSHLASGCLLVVDPDQESTGVLEDLAVIYGYQVFYKVFTIPKDFCDRPKRYCDPQYALIPKDQLQKRIKDFKNLDLGNRPTIQCYGDIEEYFRSERKPIEVMPWETILFSSDIHSHYTAFKNLPVTDWAIHCGDYIDGPEEGGSRKMIEEIYKSKSEKTIFLEGNHDGRIRRWLGMTAMYNRGKKIVAQVLRDTLPQDFLESTAKEFAGIDVTDCWRYLRAMNHKMREFVILEKQGLRYLCSHTGIKKLDQISPKFIGTVVSSSRNLDTVDQAFSEKYWKYGYISVHGHCKYPSGLDYMKYRGVLNLDPLDNTTMNYTIDSDFAVIGVS